MAAAIRETFAAKANDPILRQKREAKELRTRFNLGYVEPEHYRRVITLLKRVASEQRLNPDDVAWLITEAGCWMDELRQAWHSLEAAALTKLWENGGFPWDAVNASGHWRKAAKPEKALSLTEAAMAKVGDDPKLRSALATTRGGAMRDLHRLEEAKSLAMEAHKLTPADFRPCTLLGAVHFELGDDAAALEWYKKAETLGAVRAAIDQDLRALLFRVSPQQRQRIGGFLLAEDPERFIWVSVSMSVA